MSDDVALCESNDQIATITINRPEKMNALSEQARHLQRSANLYSRAPDRGHC